MRDAVGPGDCDWGAIVLRTDPDVATLPAAPRPGDDGPIFAVRHRRTAASRTVGAGVAGLLEALRRPGPLPARDARGLTRETRLTLAGLVLDGFLSVRHDGTFRSGARGARALIGRDLDVEPRGALPLLSLRAIRYGHALRIPDVAALTARLYFYHRLPFRPGGAGAPAAGACGSFSPDPGPGWRDVRLRPPYHRWRLWRARARPAPDRPATAGRSPAFKLYVSPRPGDLAAVFPAVAAAAGEAGATGLKVAGDAAGTLRPDKLMVYFADVDGPLRAAALLRARLAGCRPHGVPFTAALSEDGLLSWGVDPPADRRAAEGAPLGSWRSWVARRIATSLVEDGVAQGDASHAVALWRVALSGIDPRTWTPEPSFWEG